MAALAAVPVALALAVPASADADSDPAPPFIDHATWVSYGGLASLRVYPTKAGRAASTELGQPPWDADEAWAEVLAAAPDADTAGMRAQFLCHWRFAELVVPGKTSWNLEPWRPVVDDETMADAGCNPGGSVAGF